MARNWSFPHNRGLQGLSQVPLSPSFNLYLALHLALPLWIALTLFSTLELFLGLSLPSPLCLLTSACFCILTMVLTQPLLSLLLLFPCVCPSVRPPTFLFLLPPLSAGEHFVAFQVNVPSFNNSCQSTFPLYCKRYFHKNTGDSCTGATLCV